jgi:hypothetical protein
MAKEWLELCDACTGWSIVMDTKDVFFQTNPFDWIRLPQYSPTYEIIANSQSDLVFIEEISPYTSPVSDPARAFINDNGFNSGRAIPCYGKDSFMTYGKRPVLNSGTIFGTKKGLYRFLNILGELESNDDLICRVASVCTHIHMGVYIYLYVYQSLYVYFMINTNSRCVFSNMYVYIYLCIYVTVLEFLRHEMGSKGLCRSPSMTDQWTMNWLYYNGCFGDLNKTTTLPWGVGPMLTVGKVG